MKKSETIKLVQECVSSVFSKEDVIKLINDIDSQFDEETVVNIKDQILKKIRDIDHQIIDHGSAEFELNYNNTIELSNVAINEDVIEDIIDGVLMSFVEETE
jgi:late competence protein required for DNA uptake (superfamily II DNA/RNA helicase)